MPYCGDWGSVEAEPDANAERLGRSRMPYCGDMANSLLALDSVSAASNAEDAVSSSLNEASGSSSSYISSGV